jgi:hypothetical protein
MHWMSVKLPDNFQMREHSWPCRFHIIRFMIENKIDSHEMWKCADPMAGEANSMVSVYITLCRWTATSNFINAVKRQRNLGLSAVYTGEKSVWQVEHRTNASPFVEGLRQFYISVYSCLHLSLITGSDFFKLSPLLASCMPPLICY